MYNANVLVLVFTRMCVIFFVKMRPSMNEGWLGPAQRYLTSIQVAMANICLTTRNIDVRLI